MRVTKRQMKITGFLSKASENGLKASRMVPAKRRKLGMSQPLQEIQQVFFAIKFIFNYNCRLQHSSPVKSISQSDLSDQVSSSSAQGESSVQLPFSRESLLSSLVEPGWRRHLEQELQSKYMDEIAQFLAKEYKKVRTYS